MKNLLKNMFRALGHQNYLIFFSGQIVSLVGTWMQVVAASWLMYRLTNSAFHLGAVGFCGQIPTLFLVCFGGITADRYDKQKIIIVTQIASMVFTGVLALLALNDAVEVWHLYAMSILLGLVNAFDLPARQAFMVELVGKEDLTNAIVLNSSLVNAARLIGPAVAGVLIDLVGEGWCFGLNSLSYLAVITGLFCIRVETRFGGLRKAKVVTQLKDGFKFVSTNIPVLMLLIMLGAMSLLTSPQVVLMPIFARDILHGGPDTLGTLMAISGSGALCGALLLATKKTTKGLEVLIAASMITQGIAFLFFGNSTTMWISALLMVPVGLATMGQMASSNTLIQTLVPDSLRGRVMAFHAMMFVGMAPVGSLLSGACAKNFGAPNTVIAAGILLIITGTIFCFQLRKFRVQAKRLLSLTIRANRAQNAASVAILQ